MRARILLLGLLFGALASTAVARVRSSPVLGVAVELNPDPIRIESALSTRIIVANGDTVARSVELALRLPEELAFFSEALATTASTSALRAPGATESGCMAHTTAITGGATLQ